MYVIQIEDSLYSIYKFIKLLLSLSFIVCSLT